MEEKPQQETTPIETTQEEEVPIPPEVPEKTEKKWIKPLILSVLGLSVAASLVFGGYKLAQIRQVQPQPTPTPAVVPTPTPEPTTDWKTYTNTKYGYSIKYPEDWVVLEGTTDGEDYARFFKGPYSEGEPTPQTYISILIRKNPQGLLLDEWLEEDKNRPFAEKPIILTIDGVRALRWINKGEIGKDSTIIFLEKDGTIYQIASLLMAGNIEETKQTFNLMLSTFRFLEETEGWKTYMNSEYKLSFKYPTDFTIEENLVPTSNYLQVIVNKNKQDSFNIKTSKDYQPADVTYFLDTPAIGQQTIGDNTWAIYSLPEGYGLPEGTSPIYGLQLEKNGILYTLTFFDQTEITSTQNRILSTLKFID